MTKVAHAGKRNHEPIKKNSDFHALYAQYASYVWRKALTFGVPRQLVGEITQLVWESVYKRLESIDHSKPLDNWLTQVILNHVQHARRGFFRYKQKERVAENEAMTTETVDDRGTRRKEASWTLERLLRDLPDEQRDVLLLCHGEGLTANEAANVLGTNPNTVSSRLRLAVTHCRKVASGLSLSLPVLLQRYLARNEPTPAELAAVEAYVANQPPSLIANIGSAVGANRFTATTSIIIVVAAALGLLASAQAESSTSPIPRVNPPALSAPAATLPPLAETSLFAPLPASLPIPSYRQEVSPDPTPRSATARQRTSKTKPVQVTAIARPPAPPTSLAAEHRILEEAEAHMAAGRYGEALRPLGEHRRDFLNGGSAETRDLMRIRAYCGMGRINAARDVAQERPHDPQFNAKAMAPCE